ncbi:hypothetical protein F3D3_3497 [Fusibacter sp. 3D3]|nr:hypothetical protein F3D3_3497 [Fusibacter sp. 3D3]
MPEMLLTKRFLLSRIKANIKAGTTAINTETIDINSVYSMPCIKSDVYLGKNEKLKKCVGDIKILSITKTYKSV